MKKIEAPEQSIAKQPWMPRHTEIMPGIVFAAISRVALKLYRTGMNTFQFLPPYMTMAVIVGLMPVSTIRAAEMLPAHPSCMSCTTQDRSTDERLGDLRIGPRILSALTKRNPDGASWAQKFLSAFRKHESTLKKVTELGSRQRQLIQLAKGNPAAVFADKTGRFEFWAGNGNDLIVRFRHRGKEGSEIEEGYYLMQDALEEQSGEQSLSASGAGDTTPDGFIDSRQSQPRATVVGVASSIPCWAELAGNRFQKAFGAATLREVAEDEVMRRLEAETKKVTELARSASRLNPKDPAYAKKLAEIGASVNFDSHTESIDVLLSNGRKLPFNVSLVDGTLFLMPSGWKLEKDGKIVNVERGAKLQTFDVGELGQLCQQDFDSR